MLNSLSQTKLRELAAVDVAGLEGSLILSEHVRGEQLQDVVRSLAMESRRAGVVIFGLCALGLVGLMVSAPLVDTEKVPIPLKFAIPSIALCLPFLVLYFSRVLPTLADRRVRLLLSGTPFRAYFMGASPFSRNRMLLGRNYLFILTSNGRMSRVHLRDISVVGMDVRRTGALLVVAVGDQLVGIGTPGRVGGPLVDDA